MNPVVEKLGSLCARIDVLEGEVDALREEMDRQKEKISPMGINFNLPTVTSDSPVMDTSPPNDWYVGINPIGGIATEEIQEHEKPHDESRTLLDKWEAVSLYSPLELYQALEAFP
ncbi:hypothetical protein HAX54_004291 [Datura stramonium]|uniref:Uncharacterized protein n=1 Tax=Datura stramonium TaxID=4076 RepID=A0ABS8T843_DATST|nr:hypothetical protein [Datura stramonium]